VERFAVYRLYDNHYQPGQMAWGLVRVDGTRRPAFERYRAVIRLFEPTEDAAYYFSDHAALVVLRQGARTLYVMWARRDVPVTFRIGGAASDGPGVPVARLHYDGTLGAALGAQRVVTVARPPASAPVSDPATDPVTEPASPEARAGGEVLATSTPEPAPNDLSIFDGWWYTVTARGAYAADADGNIMGEGTPVRVVADGAPRQVWVEARGYYWFLH